MDSKNLGRRPFLARTLGALASLPLVQACMGGAAGKATPAAAAAGRFDFGVVGDIPYTRAQEAEYARVIADMNSRELAFVTHVGDCMFDPRPYERNPALARTPMTDENYAYVLGTFQSIRHPVVLTPGDNDWSDAVQFKKTKVDPQECLQKVRATFYPKGRSLGQRTMPVESQAQDPAHAPFVENLTWTIQGLRFVTLHTLGSHDNSKASMEEHKAREAANIAWLRKAFAAAKAEASPGLVIITHANPEFENRWTYSYASRYVRGVRGADAPKTPEPAPYDGFLDALIEQMQGYSKPVLYVHGDTHIFRIGRPLMNPNASSRTSRGWRPSAGPTRPGCG